MPIGASDYALEWHSYDETSGDYELKDFTIKRDEKYLLPYLKEALNRKPEMSLFALPWSPPTWMKIFCILRIHIKNTIICSIKKYVMNIFL